jgi:methyl-accepting chemotaxis protein
MEKPNILEKDFDLHQFEQEQKQKLLKGFSQVLLTLSIINFTIYILVFFLFNVVSLLILIITTLITGTLFSFSYYMVKKDKLQTASWILVISLFIATNVLTWILGTEVPVVVGQFLIIVIAFMFLGYQATIWVTAAAIISTCLLLLFQNFLKLYKPTLFTKELIDSMYLITILSALPTFLVLIILLLRRQASIGEFQNKRLQLAYNDLQQRQNTSSLMSQQILAIVSQLNSAATQQASGSNQQVSTVSEIAQSIEELSHTANSISDMAGQVNEAAEKIDRESREIEETTTISVERTKDGINAIEETVVASKSVAQKYQLLMEAMQSFALKSQDMRRILELLSNIATETHLLSLNAAIEAAGAGEYGVRFGVVAQETKNLAMRSSSASKEVVEIVNQVEETINSTMKIAQEGYDNSVIMEMVSNQSQEVILEMGDAVKSAFIQAGSIRGGIKNVLELAYVIKLATAQQQTASQQVLQSVRELSAVAEQFAQNSTTVSSSADNLEDLSSELNLTFAA